MQGRYREVVGRFVKGPLEASCRVIGPASAPPLGMVARSLSALTPTLLLDLPVTKPEAMGFSDPWTLRHYWEPEKSRELSGGPWAGSSLGMEMGKGIFSWSHSDCPWHDRWWLWLRV